MTIWNLCVDNIKDILSFIDIGDFFILLEIYKFRKIICKNHYCKVYNKRPIFKKNSTEIYIKYNGYIYMLYEHIENRIHKYAYNVYFPNIIYTSKIGTTLLCIHHIDYTPIHFDYKMCIYQYQLSQIKYGCKIISRSYKYYYYNYKDYTKLIKFLKNCDK